MVGILLCVKTLSFQYISLVELLVKPSQLKKKHIISSKSHTRFMKLKHLRHIQNRHPQKPTTFLCFFHQGQHIRANATAAIEMFQEGTSFGTLVAVSNCEPKLVPG